MAGGAIESKEGKSGNNDQHCRKAKDDRPEEEPDASSPRDCMGNEETTLTRRESPEFRQ
jgi:hypothetical protein